MMSTKRTALLLACLAACAHGAHAESFEGVNTAAYLKNAAALYEDAVLVAAPDLEGATVLRLRYDNELFAEFNPVPIKAGQPWTLSFKGRWQNAETLETNATFRAALRETWETGLESLPTLAIEFLDDKRAVLKPRIVGVLPYGQWKEYRQSFYPPAGAAFARLKVKSGQNQGELFITRPAFTTDSLAPSAIVMSFRSDRTQVSEKAFGFLMDDPFRPSSDKGTDLLVAGATRGDLIPLSEPGTYRLSAKGEAVAGGSHQITLTFFDAQGKKTGDVVSPDLTTRPVEFTLPEKTVSAQVLVGYGRLAELRIDRLR